jgi:hypothetical protein
MAGINNTFLTERQQYWLKHIRACDVSGQTTIDYAREHGIKVKSMYSARKALAEKGTVPRPQPTRFQQVQVVAGNPVGDTQWHIQLPNGLAVSFGGVIDAATLALILTTAATLS